MLNLNMIFMTAIFMTIKNFLFCKFLKVTSLNLPIMTYAAESAATTKANRINLRNAERDIVQPKQRQQNSWIRKQSQKE